MHMSTCTKQEAVLDVYSREFRNRKTQQFDIQLTYITDNCYIWFLLNVLLSPCFTIIQVSGFQLPNTFCKSLLVLEKSASALSCGCLVFDFTRYAVTCTTNWKMRLGPKYIHHLRIVHGKQIFLMTDFTSGHRRMAEEI